MLAEQVHHARNAVRIPVNDRQRLGVADPAVRTRSVVLDPKRQWRRAGNVWHNAMARSVLQTIVPVRRGR